MCAIFSSIRLTRSNVTEMEVISNKFPIQTYERAQFWSWDFFLEHKELLDSVSNDKSFPLCLVMSYGIEWLEDVVEPQLTVSNTMAKFLLRSKGFEFETRIFLS